MRTLAQARRDRRELRAAIARDHQTKARAKVRELRAALREARVAHREAKARAKVLCREARVQARGAIHARRMLSRLELQQWVKRARAAAAETVRAARAMAKTHGNARTRARAALEAERAYRRELRTLDRLHTARKKELRASTAKERRGESDDAVRGNIPPELVSLFNRVRGRIKASDRLSRTEAFLHYAEEHPREVLAAVDDRTEAVIAELERDQRAATRAAKRPVPRSAYAEAPF